MQVREGNLIHTFIQTKRERKGLLIPHLVRIFLTAKFPANAYLEHLEECKFRSLTDSDRKTERHKA